MTAETTQEAATGEAQAGPTFWRKKPIPVEAWQFLEAVGGSVATWCGGEIVPDGVIIHTLEGDHLGRPGDWIIKGVRGEFYPCARSIFEETYELAIESEEATPPASPLPPPVADFGPVRLELMGHRYRQGSLSEVVIAGQPFLRLDMEGGAVEFYRPDAVYCITPGIIPPAPPRTAITARFADDAWGDEGDDHAGDLLEGGPF